MAPTPAARRRSQARPRTKSLPSRSPGPLADGTPLRDWLAAAPVERLGAVVAERWGGDLPFLLKVLSVAKALSIQAHPDKQLAQQLFAERPDVYKDSNHKPEMALALSPFEALCGFLSPADLSSQLARVPELATAVGPAAAAAVAAAAAAPAGSEEARAALRGAFAALCASPPAEHTPLVTQLERRLAAAGAELAPREELALRLCGEYPGDVGVLASFFLNHITLQPGEAVALAANEPHAYLAGECVECMATSDNVVRAGLTPKLRDVPTLTAMLTYAQGAPAVMRGEEAGGGAAGCAVRSYSPPFDEFAVDSLQLAAGATLTLPPLPGPAILLVTQGEGREAAGRRLAPGAAFFVQPGTALALSAEAPLTAFRARVADAVFEAAP